MAEKRRETLRQEEIDHPEGAERNDTGTRIARENQASGRHPELLLAGSLLPAHGSGAAAPITGP